MAAGTNSQSSSGNSSGRTAGYNESGSLQISRGQSGNKVGFEEELGQAVRGNLAGTGQWSKENAMKDVQGLIKSQALDAMQENMPKIHATSRGAGIYNSTTQDQLTNDFSARLAGQLAGTQLQAIQAYGTLGNQQLAAVSGASSAGTTNTSVNESIGMSGSLGLQEGLQQATNSGSGSGWNVGFKADGGKIEKDPNKTKGPESLIGAGSSPFTLLNEYFNFDGTGRKGRLSILPEILGYAGIDVGQNKPQDVTPATPTEKPTEVSAPATPGGSKLSDGAIRFMQENGFKDVDEANEAMLDAAHKGTIHSMKGLQNVRDIKEFAPAAGAVNSVVYGGNSYSGNSSEHAYNRYGETQGGYADGGQIMDNNALRRMFADNIFQSTRNRREQEAGLDDTQAKPAPSGGVTINVNAGGSPAPAPAPAAPKEPSFIDRFTESLRDSMRESIRTERGYANGGQIQDTMNLQKAMQHYAAGGSVPHLSEQTSPSGVIKGPQTQSGRDNQLVAVGGGEGVIPADVMEVPGVSDMLQELIQKYHKPVQ